MTDDRLRKYAQFNAIELPDFLEMPNTKVDTQVVKLKTNPIIKSNPILKESMNTQEEYDDQPENAAEIFAMDEQQKNYVEKKNGIVNSINKLKTTDNNKKYLIKLAERESGFNPNVTNRFGYTGLYQFNPSSLKTVNINMKDYKTDVNKQHEAALKYGEFNLKVLKDYTKLIGSEFDGIKITKEGLMAAAHLGGAGNVKKFFDSKGKINFKDGNGVPVSSYLKMFED